MSLLIFRASEDIHAQAVAWAFSSLEKKVAEVAFSDFPITLRSSMALAGDRDPKVTIAGAGSTSIVDLSEFDVVWNRRFAKVTLDPRLNEADHRNARKASNEYLANLRDAAGSRQVWVNDSRAQMAIENKFTQLRLARDCGFRVPNTLISNDPADVRAFVAGRKCIVKGFWPMSWGTPEKGKRLSTVALTPKDLTSDISIKACPMIYQQMIEKQYELRVVCFGQEIVACKILSAQVPEAVVDFRLADPKDLNVHEVDIPPDVVDKIMMFMERAGIIHGSFDIAVDLQGDHYFFEVNEQGQTLWLEDANSSIRILDRTVAFLEAPSSTFRWNGDRRFAFDDFTVEHGI